MKKILSILAIALLALSAFTATFAGALASTGGPDSFGYTFIDSNSIGGPTYNWIEISGTGTFISGMADTDDSYVSNIPLGFFFNFYGTDYSQITVGNNGILFSNFGSSQYTNQPITQSGIHGFIAPFWDDIVTWNGDGAIYYQTLGTAPHRTFVVEWYNNQHYNTSPSGITFEAILYEGTNNILFQYQDTDFGQPGNNNGGSATVGIENPDGNIGLQYSYNQAVITPGLAILYKFPAFQGTNMYLTMRGPASLDNGHRMTYTISYNNFGGDAAANVQIQTTLSSNVVFVSSANEDAAADQGTYDATNHRVTWDIGTLPSFPNGRGSVSVTVDILETVPVGTVVTSTSTMSTSTLETRYDDNSASVSTTITGTDLPPNVNVGPLNGNSGTTPTVYWGNPITFTFTDTLYGTAQQAFAVDINIHINDGGADIFAGMSGPSSAGEWTYTVTFYPRHGQATVTYTPHRPGVVATPVQFTIYIDPAGYIYNTITSARIAGATVWLQRPDGAGGWENVPTGESPPISDPDTNPLITNVNGQYEWLTLPGTYRVHVEAVGYEPADSIAVTVPPPVFDLNVGLTPSVHTPTASFTVSAPTSTMGTPVNFDPSGSNDPYDPITQYEWDWTSDGTFDATTATPDVTAHTFTAVGTYTVTLRITDSLGYTATTTQQVNIVNIPDANVASVFTTDVSGSLIRVLEFYPGQTVYVEYTIQSGKNADIEVVDIHNNPIGVSYLGLSGSGEFSFVPPTPGTYYVNVNGYHAAQIAQTSFFVLPESIFGAFAALGAGIAAFGAFRVIKRKK